MCKYFIYIYIKVNKHIQREHDGVHIQVYIVIKPIQCTRVIWQLVPHIGATP